MKEYHADFEWRELITENLRHTRGFWVEATNKHHAKRIIKGWFNVLGEIRLVEVAS